MKIISVDAGALYGHSSSHYGNYTFSKELILALQKYDQTNSYRFYLQELSNIVPQKKSLVLKPRLGWLKLGVSLQEIISPANVFLGLNQALPWYCSGKKIVFCHGTAPLDFPKLYPDSQKRMRQQVKQMLNNADWIVVGSRKLKTRLNDIYREDGRGVQNQKIKVVNYGIGQDYLHHKPQKKQPIILYVGSSHPIKNLPFLFQAFSQFLKVPGYSHYQLQLVGIQKTFKAPEKLINKVQIINHCQSPQLLRLYRTASCLVSASFEESFNLPVLEALSQQTPVVGTKSAIIPEFKPYVSLAPNSPPLFAQKIHETLVKPKKNNLIKLKQQFSWQNYVHNLIKLYE